MQRRLPIKPQRCSCLLPVQAPDLMPRPGIGGSSPWCLTDRGVASREVGNRDRAAFDFDEAAQVAETVAQDDESYDDSQYQLALIAKQRGELLSTDVAKLPQSESSYEQAIAILTKLITNHKLVPHYREEVAAAHCGRAAVRIAMKRISDAALDCEAALVHLDGLIAEQTQAGAPENPQYLSLLGQVVAQKSRIHFLEGRSAEGRSTAPRRSKN